MTITRLLLISIFSALLATGGVAAPFVQTSANSLDAETLLTVNFDKPMVDVERIDKKWKNVQLAINPPLKHHLVWNTRSQAKIVLQEVPKAATEYEIALQKGLKHQDGTLIDEMKVFTIKTPDFRLDYGTRIRGENSSIRSDSYLLRFNLAVSPEVVDDYLFYQSDDDQKVRARVKTLIASDVSSQYYRKPSWTQRFQRTLNQIPQEFEPNDALPASILVSPVTPLPIGENWRLVLKEGLPSQFEKLVLPINQSRRIGSVKPLSLSSVSGVVALDTPRYIQITFNHELADYDGKQLSKLIKVRNLPRDAQFKLEGRTVRIDGDFSNISRSSISFSPEITSRDGLNLGKTNQRKVQFTPLKSQLTLPGFDHGLFAKGTRSLDILAVNMKDCRIRLKKLNRDQLPLAMQAYRHYKHAGPHFTEVMNGVALPYELIPGEQVLDNSLKLSQALDTSNYLPIDWNEITGGNQNTGAYFIQLNGIGSTRGDKVCTQAIVQLTDIGLGWKYTNKEALVYAYSCETGGVLPGVQLRIAGSDGKVLHEAKTDQQGTARFPRSENDYYLVASKGEDLFSCAFSGKISSVQMWRFPVRYSWHAQPEHERKVFLFSDRTLYRPGETAHIKGILRDLAGNAIHLSPDQKAQLIFTNERGQTLVKEDIAFSTNGTFDRSFDLPEGNLGTYQVRVHFPRPEGQSEPDGWYQSWIDTRSRTFDHHFLVSEFRRNAFEVSSEILPVKPGATSFDLALKADYYQGEPVGNGEVSWFYRAEKTGFYPEKYRDFLFGDHREYDSHYWYHYFGYRDSGHSSTRSKSENGELTLDQDGEARLSLNIPDSEFPSPSTLTVDSEIIDSNDQTLSTTAKAVFHPVDTYLGIQRLDALARIGDVIELPVVAVNHSGTALQRDLTIQVSVERHWTEKSAILDGEGRKTIQNEEKSEVVSTQELLIRPETSTKFEFEPRDSGRHVVCLIAKDSAGREIKTASAIHVYGDQQYPWAYQSGMRIKLVPEKTHFRPGETARILVQTPIEGTALVTVERDKVLRTFVQELSASDPMIELPLDHLDAPNVFVSVMVIRGADASLKKIKEPELKLGYCELFIENEQQKLTINFDEPSGSKRPGESITLGGIVRDSAGKPLANAEVVLYAEDEGVLSVMGYKNPEPMDYFYEARFLRVSAGTSLGEFLTEDPSNRFYANKGFFVGGGGGFNAPNLAGEVRKDFNPCAVWAPRLTTDETGRFSTSYISPDTLTRYRIIAVALHGKDRFGTGTSEVTITKPVMLEAADPRFASEGDRIDAKVSLTNASPHTGTWTVSLDTGDCSSILINNAETTASKTLSLAPGERKEVSFPVSIDRPGNATWTWNATPIEIQSTQLSESVARELSDAMQSEFEVTFPMPLLRERQVRLSDPENPNIDLLNGFSPDLLSGHGEITVELSSSQLVRARAAGDYLLRYPYGCLEQTSSSMMPWLTVGDLAPYLPAFAAKSDAERKKAIKRGVQRLLSMQNFDGSFSYWPGNNNTSHWASSYAALCLTLAKQGGADVPEDAVDRFCNFLRKQLTITPENAWEAEKQARTLWVLAMAGKPDIAYENKLTEAPALLGASGRAFLALAIAERNDPSADKLALSLIEGKFAETNNGYWMRHRPSSSLEVLALCSLDAPSEKIEIALDKLLSRIKPNGHWGTTWVNSWALQAMAAVARKEAHSIKNSELEITIGNQTRKIDFNEDKRTELITISLDELSQLKITTKTGRAVAIATIAAKPPLSGTAARAGSSGITLTRHYQRMLADGSLEELENPKVGDLVLVTLSLRIPSTQRYLAVDDPIPACFEIVNDQFDTQSAAGVDVRFGSWNLSNKELRDDRAVFFFNYISSKGGEDIKYLARITRSGATTAPSAKAEPMYQPDLSALSNSSRLEVSPR